VDEAIDATAAHFNLRDAIQDFRVKAEEASDEESKHRYLEKGASKGFSQRDLGEAKR
jgi:hypothetical protein